ncbi:MAG: alanyl-tRNA synthetase [Candidatus Magasanikbacteria bacterium GW2011_GWA2_45_39]|uniref:alanine--tRNA ligase n=2 Tax=Candidatus Magasanikiibacteriota TaxID=1752731 RepID=A0A0G1Q884_9BACT|nr:MAG: alanyl-tRNA synthetase [Candidatus Magasanikbacteria bacterium GW2011_GWA2_45_39]KKU13953.1 MAG: alanyl-tRNA synthetase [Candidatus Magasanikbacteria bacterium GW2011_GWC2_45_8]
MRVLSKNSTEFLRAPKEYCQEKTFRDCLIGLISTCMNFHAIRQAYIDFFAKKGHAILPAASLIPENDPTTLFTSSGMQPLIPYLLGAPHPQGTRLVDSQKCFRSQDIEEVGDNRHTTFFEMLGNWSLGGYFKEEQIHWVFELVTGVLGLDPARLYVTCFRGNEDFGIPRDEVSAKLWQKIFADKHIDAPIIDFSERDGMGNGHIFYYDETKNWWSRSGVPSAMPEGEPGGPDTEMFWDFGVHFHNKWAEESPVALVRAGRKKQKCHVNCDCGRFMEIGNSVFMEYVKNKDGFEKLKQHNVDFGGGLERLAAAIEDCQDIFRIDIFAPLIKHIENLSGKQYGADQNESRSFRMILDHARAATFLIADGATPSNKDQGYFTRRLLRRAVFHAQKLGIASRCCGDLAELIIDSYGGVYPQLKERKESILEAMNQEEIKFGKALKLGLKELDNLENVGGIEKVSDGLLKTINRVDGVKAFFIHQSFGIPLEMIQERLSARGLLVDEAEFNNQVEAEKKKHQDISRAGAEKKFKGGLADHSDMSIKYHTATHLLHAALRKVLGESVEQRGSNITPERLRFDFSFSRKMTPEEIKATEDLVNGSIKRNYSVSWQIMTVDEAKNKKAIGLFEEKYGEKVKVYTVGDTEQVAKADFSAPTFSREFCGGPHVEFTGVIGHFKILKEEACSAGIRRIKAIAT